MSATLRVAEKELSGFFSTPTAYIFFAAFLVAVLFDFFWVETFFARNIADVRPMFAVMPLLLIFLSSAITMRLWSEERRAGTLEILLTAPVTSLRLVLGKFVACLGLVAIALVLTLPIPLCVSLMGGLDWGPVLGGYVAALFLAAAYLAIGLFVSARSENQIVSLIVSSLICSAFYLIGSGALTDLVGNRGAEWLQLIATGARFESITRGVIDLRDLYYYLSLVGVFLALNVHAIEKLRWAGNPARGAHRRWAAITGLLCVNLVAANVPLHAFTNARADITRGHVYSISDATRSYLAQLREPLLIRGYFSAKTHPLLAPLVPRLRDLIKEYEIAGNGRVRVEFVDPHDDAEVEREAGEKYGIRPVPFQTASKYQASVVNSYFDVLVQYGDQFETLGFRDLIDIKAQSETDVQVNLRNPEYDITRAIKKVIQSYQGADNLFVNLPKVTFTGYLTPDDQLPDTLRKVRAELNAALKEYQQKAGDKLVIRFEDPDAGDGSLAKRLREQYGFRPMTTSILDSRRFWFYMVLEADGKLVQIPLPEELDSGDIKRGLQAAFKRFSRGFLKTVAIYAPKAGPDMSRFGIPSQDEKHYSALRDRLAQDYELVDTDLKSGAVPEQADFLLVLSPENLDDRQVFAVDQFLMRGGSVLIAGSPYKINMRGSLTATKVPTGLEDWLKHDGISLEDSIVLDPRNTAFPVPVQRNLGGFVINEAQLVDYPYFSDLRTDGLDQKSGLLTGIEQLTMNWASPIKVAADKLDGRRLIRLLTSSAKSWVSDDTNIQPDFQSFGPLGFAAQGQRGARDIGVVVEGQFDSYFKDKPSPLIKEKDKAQKDKKTDEKPKETQIDRVIERSPDSGRIILISSATFMSDEILDLVSSTMGTRYRTPVQLIENAVDWSLEDRGLLAIRGRAEFAHTLPPLERSGQMFWEYTTYALVLAGLVVVWFLYRVRRRRAEHTFAAWLNVGEAKAKGGAEA
ncbi:MAG: ABC transporter permease subunit [Gammaproteobacteria bacterium]|nr:ABC transporter permease subunit [Gammaproteobacteria bacterium]